MVLKELTQFQNKIKVIDFGSSCFDKEKMYAYIQSRFYRAPEIIMDLGYSLEIDMWSLGCIIAELFTGIPIFPGENEPEQLGFIMEYLGKPKKEMIQLSLKKEEFFHKSNNPFLKMDIYPSFPCILLAFFLLDLFSLIYTVPDRVNDHTRVIFPKYFHFHVFAIVSCVEPARLFLYSENPEIENIFVQLHSCVSSECALIAVNNFDIILSVR